MFGVWGLGPESRQNNGPSTLRNGQEGSITTLPTLPSSEPRNGHACCAEVLGGRINVRVMFAKWGSFFKEKVKDYSIGR